MKNSLCCKLTTLPYLRYKVAFVELVSFTVHFHIEHCYVWVGLHIVKWQFKGSHSRLCVCIYTQYVMTLRQGRFSEIVVLGMMCQRTFCWFLRYSVSAFHKKSVVGFWLYTRRNLNSQVVRDMVLCVFVSSCRRFVIAPFPHLHHTAETLDYPEDGISATLVAVYWYATWQRVLENAYLQCRCEYVEFRALSELHYSKWRKKCRWP
jgi:hypothetical protein